MLLSSSTSTCFTVLLGIMNFSVVGRMHPYDTSRDDLITFHIIIRVFILQLFMTAC